MRLRTLISSTLLSLFLAACQKVPAMNDAEKQQLQPLISQMKTRCLGRYLVDVPAQMVPGFSENAGLEIDGITIAVEPMNRARFDLLLQQRTTQLKALHLLDEPTKKGLDEIISLPDGNGVVFNRTEDDKVPTLQIGRVFELHSWKAGYRISMRINADDVRYADPEGPIVKNGIQSDTKEKLTQLLALYPRVRGRAFDDTPAERGLCFHNGFVEGPPAEQENFYMRLVTQGMEDVVLHVLSHNDFWPEENLLDRVPDMRESFENRAKDKNGEYRMLLAQARQSRYGLPFEEMLDHRPTDEGYGPKHDYVQGNFSRLEVYDKKQPKKSPFLSLMLFNGQRQSNPRESSDQYEKPWPELTKASLSDAQTVALWHAITDTLRLNPAEK